jgi:hypothetical protein
MLLPAFYLLFSGFKFDQAVLLPHPQNADIVLVTWWPPEVGPILPAENRWIVDPLSLIFLKLQRVIPLYHLLDLLTGPPILFQLLPGIRLHIFKIKGALALGAVVIGVFDNPLSQALLVEDVLAGEQYC